MINESDHHIWQQAARIMHFASISIAEMEMRKLFVYIICIHSFIRVEIRLN